MPDDEDWLMRPILKGMCSYESLIEGRIYIEDIARMNDAIDVFNENQQRLRDADDG